MTTKTIINQAQALELIQAGNKKLIGYEVVFDQTPIEAADAIRLGSAGFIPDDDLVYYDDSKIDYSDIPEMSDEELDRFVRYYTIKVPVRMDIERWIGREKVNLTDLVEKLLNEYYEKQKDL